MPTVMPPPQLPTKEDEVWLNGALLVDKPLKWTSSDVVCKLRGALDVKKIGHGAPTHRKGVRKAAYIHSFTQPLASFTRCILDVVRVLHLG